MLCHLFDGAYEGFRQAGGNPQAEYEGEGGDEEGHGQGVLVKMPDTSRFFGDAQDGAVFHGLGMEKDVLLHGFGFADAGAFAVLQGLYDFGPFPVVIQGGIPDITVIQDGAVRGNPCDAQFVVRPQESLVLHLCQEI